MLEKWVVGDKGFQWSASEEGLNRMTEKEIKGRGSRIVITD